MSYWKSCFETNTHITVVPFQAKENVRITVGIASKLFKVGIFLFASGKHKPNHDLWLS